jgi:hypothetical protein
MGRMIPTPNERAAIKQFLYECTDLHIDGVDFTHLPSGVAMTVHYRDAKGHAQRKTIQNPDATHIAHIEDMAVLMSEWLVHPAARAGEFLSAGGVN